MKSHQFICLFAILFFLILSGNSCDSSTKTKEAVDTTTLSPPNILWLVAEDLSPTIPSFGDSTIQTPNLSRLAAEGVRYTNVYSVSGVCSPSRAALATGMYPSGVGANHMRTLKQQPDAIKLGLINYECVLPPEVKMVSELMRENGYYSTNNSKQDYQFYPSKMAWDESSNYAHWRNGPKDQPFFSIFNFFVTHESQIFNPAHTDNFRYNEAVYPPPRSKKIEHKQYKEGEEKPFSVPLDLKVNVPPYLPDTDKVKKDVRRMYSNIVEMDKQVGGILKQLEEDGKLENTIIVWYTDHGGPLPRQKRLVYDSGLKVPMIIRYPKKWQAGTVDDQLISFIDFAPTLLSMANIDPPEYMDGKAFVGKYQESTPRKYIHAAADRFDECYDMIRAVKDKRFKYLKNFQPEKPYYLPVEYRERMATTQELLRLKKAGKLNEYQAQWFRNSKPVEELFDTKNDPHELHNLAEDPEYAAKLAELREECDKWMEEIKDVGNIPETELIEQFWPNKIQPITAAPSVKTENGETIISCTTEGASIGYKYDTDTSPGMGWRIYKEPIKVPKGKTIQVIAHRIGYAPSEGFLIEE